MTNDFDAARKYAPKCIVGYAAEHRKDQANLARCFLALEAVLDELSNEVGGFDCGLPDDKEGTIDDLIKMLISSAALGEQKS